MKQTQCSRVIQYMKDFGSITSADAIREIGCYRLASRISDLKKQGYDIDSKFTVTNNRYGEPVRFKEYFLGGDVHTDNSS